jgi:hypothetical protein
MTQRGDLPCRLLYLISPRGVGVGNKPATKATRHEQYCGATAMRPKRAFELYQTDSEDEAHRDRHQFYLLPEQLRSLLRPCLPPTRRGIGATSNVICKESSSFQLTASTRLFRQHARRASTWPDLVGSLPLTHNRSSTNGRRFDSGVIYRACRLPIFQE